MTYSEMIRQLMSIRAHCISMISPDDEDDIWTKDFKALTKAINILNEMKPEQGGGEV